MKLTFRQIDAFRTVMATGTVTEAAKMLGISQPAVSRLISDLEEQVGFKLFQRAGRSLKPTVEARLLVEEVRRALSGLERIKEAATAIRNFRHARLSLITTPTFSTMVVPELIAGFAARRPEAMVSLEVQPADDTVEWMVSQNYDFGITPAIVGNPAINTRDLVDKSAVCIVPTGHKLAGRDQIVASDLAGESFISYVSQTQFRFVIDELFRKAGITRKMQYEARTTDAICRLVAAGLGVSIVGTVDVARAATVGCVAIPFSPSIPFSAMLIWTKQRTLSAVAEDFLQMIEEGG